MGRGAKMSVHKIENWKYVLFLSLALTLLLGQKCPERNLKMTGQQQPPATASVEIKAMEASDKTSFEDDFNTIVEPINHFSFSLYQELEKKPDNIFFSPFSLFTVMAMVYEGARGQTAEEIKQVFFFPEDIQLLRTGQKDLLAILNKEPKKYELRTANALWAQKNFPFLPAYFENVGKYYGGKVTSLDFISETEQSRQVINHWVEEQTNQKIKDLIPAGVLNSFTRLVLTNAIYFKGRWAKPFPKENTAEQDFHVSEEKTVRIPFMHLQEVGFNYAENEILQAVELPYEGKELSMVILLPRGKISDLRQFLNSASWQELKKNFRHQTIDVYLPGFKLETKYLMGGENGILARMGMPSAFSETNADLSGMTGRPNLYITEVVHQAFVEVNEEGTEAAAATGAIMGVKAVLMKKVFRADHPFIFFVQEKRTGAILFLGRVMDPTR